MSVELDVIAEGVGAEMALNVDQFVNHNGHRFVDDVDATQVLLAVQVVAHIVAVPAAAQTA